MRNPPADRSQSEAEFDPVFADSIVPSILAKELASETTGKSELGHVGFADSYAIECANHRVQQVRHQEPIKLVPAIGGRDQIEAVVINGSEKIGEPFGSDVFRFGGDHHTGLGSKQFGGRQNRPQRNSALRGTGIFCADRVQRAERVHIRGPTHIIDGNASDQFGSAVARSSVGIDDDCSLSRKSAEDAASNRVDDRIHSLGIIVSGQADKDVHLADIDQLAKKIIGKKISVFQFRIPCDFGESLAFDALSSFAFA